MNKSGIKTDGISYCNHADKEGELTWLISKGPQTSGPCCGACLAMLWGQLSRYPDAVATATIWPIEVIA